MPATNHKRCSAVFCSMPLRIRIFEPDSSKLNRRQVLPQNATATGTSALISRKRQRQKQAALIIRQVMDFNTNFMLSPQKFRLIGRIRQISKLCSFGRKTVGIYKNS